jgi:hypothetical protein
MTFDLRAWALHDAVFQLARDAGLRSFRVECKLGAEGETIIALILARPALASRDLPFDRRDGMAGSPRVGGERPGSLAEPRSRDDRTDSARSARKRPAR